MSGRSEACPDFADQSTEICLPPGTIAGLITVGQRKREAMILEVATLNVRAGEGAAFEQAFSQAQSIISAVPGYVSHQLQRCLESQDRYLLLVQWQRLEDHTVGFRQSPKYQDWKELLHHFYEPFPAVEHYEPVFAAQQGVREGGA